MDVLIKKEITKKMHFHYMTSMSSFELGNKLTHYDDGGKMIQVTKSHPTASEFVTLSQIFVRSFEVHISD